MQREEGKKNPNPLPYYELRNAAFQPAQRWLCAKRRRGHQVSNTVLAGLREAVAAGTSSALITPG